MESGRTPRKSVRDPRSGRVVRCKGSGNLKRPRQLQATAREWSFQHTKKEFYEILNRYEGARFIANLLPRELALGKGFEEALAYFAYHVDEPLKAHFAHVPPYLRDLLRACSDSYTPDPTCYIYLVTEFLAEHHDFFLEFF